MTCPRVCQIQDLCRKKYKKGIFSDVQWWKQILTYFSDSTQCMIFARIGHGPCYYHWNEIFAGVARMVHKKLQYYDIFICVDWLFNESRGVCYAPTFNKLTRFWRLEKGLYVIFLPQIQSGGGAVNFVQIQKMLANLFHSRFSIFQFSILNHNNWRWSSFAFVFHITLRKTHLSSYH